ncbi:phosphatidylglycerophosphatase A [Shewanella sp. YIC-542]|uniref:phosphatidylglycerophosphatase A family protein n=1 Tax=Shewanella mytili TaxID=3377111 RepID=UPI00398E9E9B
MSFFSKDETLSRLSLGNPIHFLALGFGSGLAAVAPGTFGTLAAIPLYLLLALLPLPAYGVVTLLVCLAGIFICDRTCRDLGVHDHKAIVWDEVAGYLLTMLAAPSGWYWPIVGFVLFRFFDIIKPWPIRWVDANVQGGFGVMADDIMAGIASCACLQLLALALL